LIFTVRMLGDVRQTPIWRLLHQAHIGILINYCPITPILFSRPVKDQSMAVDIEKYIDELRHTVTVAGLNYEIWWVYKSKDTRPHYLDAMVGMSKDGI